MDLGQIFLESFLEAKEFKLLPPEDSRRPDLLVFELSRDTTKELDFIQSLLDADKVGEVFLTSEHTDPETLMKAMRIGAKEFFSQPIKKDQIRAALETFKNRQNHSGPKTVHKSGQILSVMGSKGGVGSTTVAVNLAAALTDKDQNKSVALLDMNILFGEIPLFLEITPKFHWGEITKNIDRLDETFLMNVLSRHDSGLHILPSPGYLNGHQAPTPAMMARLLELMKKHFDFVIIDSGQTTDETSLKIFQMSDQLLLVTILSLPCLSNTNKLIQSLSTYGYMEKSRIKVVMNRYIKKSDLSLEDARASIHGELFWTIPNDYTTTMAAINQGKLISQISPKSPISKNFKKMAEAICPMERGHDKKRWGFFKRRT